MSGSGAAFLKHVRERDPKVVLVLDLTEANENWLHQGARNEVSDSTGNAGERTP
jgi:hypothetical protein